MKILLHISPLSRYVRNTDARYLSNFISAPNYFPNIHYDIDNTWLNGSLDFINNLTRRVVFKLPLGKEASIKCEKLLNLSYLPTYCLKENFYNAILTHGSFPICLSNHLPPIIWETGMSDLNYYQRLFNSPVKGKQVWQRRVKVNEIIGSKAAIIGISHPAAADRFKRLIPKLSNRVRVLPPFLPHISSIPWDNIAEKFLSRDKLKLTFVGNQAKRKGLEKLYEALLKLPSRCLQNLQITVVSAFRDGFVPPPSEIKVDYFSDLTYEQVNQILSETHIYCMPSRAEAYGFTYIEAMAHGCVVIASEQEPQDYILDYGNAGLLIDPNNSDSIVKALTQTINDIDYCSILAKNAWERVQNILGPNASAKAYKKVFQEIS